MKISTRFLKKHDACVGQVELFRETFGSGVHETTIENLAHAVFGLVSVALDGENIEALPCVGRIAHGFERGHCFRNRARLVCFRLQRKQFHCSAHGVRRARMVVCGLRRADRQQQWRKHCPDRATEGAGNHYRATLTLVAAFAIGWSWTTLRSRNPDCPCSLRPQCGSHRRLLLDVSRPERLRAVKPTFEKWRFSWACLF